MTMPTPRWPFQLMQPRCSGYRPVHADNEQPTYLDSSQLFLSLGDRHHAIKLNMLPDDPNMIGMEAKRPSQADKLGCRMIAAHCRN
jgi:hypothetical protein